MLIPSEIRDYLKYIAQSVNKAIPVTAIYLFGSYADGTYREGKSDLDIYVVSPDTSKRRLDLGVAARLSFERKLDIPIELIVNHEYDFEERKDMQFSLEYDVVTKGVNINAL